MTNPTQPAEGMPELKPCPWCGSSNIKMFSIMDSDERVEYAQCQDCTGMGPDHKSGRHWNSRTPMPDDAKAALAKFFDRLPLSSKPLLDWLAAQGFTKE